MWPGPRGVKPQHPAPGPLPRQARFPAIIRDTADGWLSPRLAAERRPCRALGKHGLTGQPHGWSKRRRHRAAAWGLQPIVGAGSPFRRPIKGCLCPAASFSRKSTLAPAIMRYTALYSSLACVWLALAVARSENESSDALGLAETPAETTAQKSAETTAQKSAETTAQKSAETTAQKPAETTTLKPTGIVGGPCYRLEGLAETSAETTTQTPGGIVGGPCFRLEDLDAAEGMLAQEAELYDFSHNANAADMVDVADTADAIGAVGAAFDDIDGALGEQQPQDSGEMYDFSNTTTAVPRVPQNKKALGDAFYVEPANIESYYPGQVLRMREITPSAMPKNTRAMYQIMVRSTDSLGQAVAIVASLLMSSKGTGERLLSFQVPTDLPCVDCAPSTGMLDPDVKLEKPLEYGWDVVVPDFQGLHAAFGAARLAGQATLDAVRGALVTGKVSGMTPRASVALWGYSGGLIATGWAATLQPQYAPELKEQLVGAAMGGWITNYESTIAAIDGKYPSGLVGMALSGLVAQYPELAPVYKNYVLLERKVKVLLEKAKTWCLLEGLLRLFMVRFFTGRGAYFAKGALQDPTVRRVLDANTVALLREVGVPECPVFLHHALRDAIAPVEDTRRAVQNYCDWGIGSFEINYVRFTGHISESYDGAGAAVAWIKKRFDGVLPSSGCVTKTWGTLRDYPDVDHRYMKTLQQRKRDVELASAWGPDATAESRLAFARTIMPLP